MLVSKGSSQYQSQSEFALNATVLCDVLFSENRTRIQLATCAPLLEKASALASSLSAEL
jgi:hypothetical protein